MIDYSALLYDPIYAELGVDATLTAGASTVTITVIDETRRKTIPGAVEVSGVGPSVFARMPELIANGITSDNWDGASLAFNGGTWIIRKGDPLGSPNGEDFGEVQFSLKEAAVG